MGKLFTYSVFSLLIANFLYKSILYISREKTSGTIIQLNESYTFTRTSKSVYKEIFIVPVIAFSVGKDKYVLETSNWDFLTTFRVNDKIEIIYNEKDISPQINTFLYYWLKPKEIAFVFGLSVLLTIIIETVKFYKKNPEA